MRFIPLQRRLCSPSLAQGALAALFIASFASCSLAASSSDGGSQQQQSSSGSPPSQPSSAPGSSSSDYGGPPMGWSSWTSFAGPVSEQKLYEVAQFLLSSGMASAGYNILTLDEGWSQTHDRSSILIDEYGRPVPNPDLYPSSQGGAGMKPIAEKLHSMGLKLGLWMLRGVPVTAVRAKSPILGGGGATVDQIVRYDKNCSWSNKAVGTTWPDPGATAYYNSVAKQINDWGADFVKADCMFPGTPYPPLAPPTGYFDDDLYGLAGAFQGVPRITLSLSPGISMTPWNATTIASKKLAKMYRVTEDLWDVWDGPANGSFPSGIKQKFGVGIKYAKMIGQGGTFPDFDILPLGVVHHADPGREGVYGPASPTRLTKDEQRTTMTLWAFFRSPLFFGGQLPTDDRWTLDLVTNSEILAIVRSSTDNAPVFTSATDGKGKTGSLFAWRARPGGGGSGQCPQAANGAKPEACAYLGLFNTDDEPRSFAVKLADVFPDRFGPNAKVSSQGGSSSVILCARDLWSKKPFQVPQTTFGNSSSSSGGSGGGKGATSSSSGSSAQFSAGSIPAHGSMAFMLSVVNGESSGGKSSQEVCGI